MATVTVSRPNVTQDELLAALRDQLGGATTEAHGGSEVRVKTGVFSHARVQILPGGGGTSFKVSPYMVGPVGYVISMFGIVKHVAGAIENAPQLRASS
jgi:hypothetical protein